MADNPVRSVQFRCFLGRIRLWCHLSFTKQTRKRQMDNSLSVGMVNTPEGVE